MDRRGDLGRFDGLAGEGERPGGRQLERGRRLEVADPHGAVDRGAADRAVALGDDRPGLAAQRGLPVAAEQVEWRIVEMVEHAGVALGGADAAQDGLGRVARPVDRAVGLPEQRAQAAPRARVVVVQRLGRDVAAHGVHDGVDRGAPHLVAVQARLARALRERERARRPDVACVDLVRGLEHGHAPLGGTGLDRPVQRRRATIALRAGMDDQAAMPGPDRLGDDRLEHRADDQPGPVLGHRGLHLGARAHDLHRNAVAELGQRDLDALAEAVVGGDEEEDSQARERRGRRAGRLGSELHAQDDALGLRAIPAHTLQSRARTP